MAMVLLKLVIPVVEEDTDNVMIAATDCPAASWVPCWFQPTVR